MPHQSLLHIREEMSLVTDTEELKSCSPFLITHTQLSLASLQNLLYLFVFSIPVHTYLTNNNTFALGSLGFGLCCTAWPVL